LIPSGLVALIFAVTLPLNVVNTAFFLRQRVEPIVIMASVIGISGIALVFWSDLTSAPDHGDSVRGIALTLGAAMCFSLGNVVSDRTQRAGVPVVQSEAYGLAYGAIALVPVTLVTGGFRIDLRAPYLLGLGYLVIFGSVVGFTLYLRIVGRVGAERAGYITVLFPIVALVWSTLLEHYAWTVRAFVGALLILIGCALVVTPKGLFDRIMSRDAPRANTPLAGTTDTTDNRATDEVDHELEVKGAL